MSIFQMVNVYPLEVLLPILPFCSLILTLLLQGLRQLLVKYHRSVNRPSQCTPFVVWVPSHLKRKDHLSMFQLILPNYWGLVSCSSLSLQIH